MSDPHTHKEANCRVSSTSKYKESDLYDDRSKSEGVVAPHSVAFVDFSNRTVLLSRDAALLRFPVATQVPPENPKIYGCIGVPDEWFLQAAQTLLHDLTRSYFHICILMKSSSEGGFLTKESALIECVPAPPPKEPLQAGVVDRGATPFDWVPFTKLCSWIDEGFGWKHKGDENAWLLLQKFVLTAQHDGIKPWQKPGWLAQACQTARCELRGLNFELTGPFVLLCISTRSILMCSTGSDGRLIYLKGSTPFEGAVTRFAAQYAPLIVSAPLYVNRDEGWMLMEDAGNPIFGSSKDEVERLVLLYARLQLVATTHIQELIEFEVPVRNADTTTDAICEMLENDDVRAGMQRLGCEFMKQSKREVRSCLHKFMTIMFEERGLPLSLVHNDIFYNNVVQARGSGQIVLLDWERAKIDIAFDGFLDFRRLLGENAGSSIDFDEYFNAWSASGYGSSKDLEDNAWLLYLTKTTLEKLLPTFEDNKRDNFRHTLSDNDLSEAADALEIIAEALDDPFGT